MAGSSTTTTTSSNHVATAAVVAATAAAAAAATAACSMPWGTTSKKSKLDEVPAVLSVPSVAALIAKHSDALSDESLIKLMRQLDFWYKQGLDEEVLVETCASLIETATLLPKILSGDLQWKVPTVRYGKTELQMPIITCGGMRLQQSWIPDHLPIAPNRARVLQSDSQANLKACIRTCLAVGVNHFETARGYGTSEYQFAKVLQEMIQEGEIKREDFILQTKIVATSNAAEFETLWKRSWANLSVLGYIDLFAFHCVSTKEAVENVLSLEPDSCMVYAKQLQEQGLIKHIGFSTHGYAGPILQLIESERFSFVNIHSHFTGSYHAEGTEDGRGGHGNQAAVQRALELDMGVFQISPMDKGGMAYCPSKTVTATMGPKLSPLVFNALHSWKTQSMHTMSVGVGRPSDLDEVLQAAYLFSKGDDSYATELQAAEERLNARMRETVGQEWVDRGMLGLPDCEQECTNGIALGHVLWCHNLMAAFGMYDFCRARYANLESMNKWNDKVSFEENRKKMNGGNMGRAYVASVDLTKALEQHYDPPLVLSKLAETHEWLCTKSHKSLTEQDRRKRGWEAAYDLRLWETFPGDNPTAQSVVLQNLSFGLLGCGGGPKKAAVSVADMAEPLREALAVPS